MKARQSISHAAMFVGLALCAAAAGAQPVYPSQPIKVVVPFPPAGGTDVLTRVVANEVTVKDSKWTFIVDNKPGAGGNSVARGGTPVELGAFMKSEHARWGAAVRESGAKLD